MGLAKGPILGTGPGDMRVKLGCRSEKSIMCTYLNLTVV